MPEFLIVDGVKVYSPGAYATVDASALSGSGDGSKAVAYVGDFPEFEPAQPTRFFSGKDLERYDGSSSLLKLWAKLAFSPSQDSRVSGGAGSLTIVNAGTSTQAQHTLPDNNATDAVTLKSAIWGAKGNRVSYTVANDADGSRNMTTTLVNNGVTEVIKSKAVDVGTISYDGSFFVGVDSSVTLDWDATRANIAWQKGESYLASASLPVSLTPPAWEAPINGKIVAAMDAINAAQTINVTIDGFDSLGAAQNEVLVLTNGTLTATTSSDFSGYVTDITFADAVGGGTLTDAATLTVSSQVLGLELPAADYDTLQDMVRAIDSQPYFGGVVTEPRAIPSSEPDKTLTINNGLSDAGAVSDQVLRADLWGYTQALSNSSIVEAVRAASAEGPPAPSGDTPASAVSGFLLGGGATVADSTSWQAALDSIRNVDVNFITPETDDITILNLLPAHFDAAALNGYPRQAWAGSAEDLSLATLRTAWSNVLNNAYIGLVVQAADTPSPSGAGTKRLTPAQYALQHAAAQAAMSPGTPLTGKRLDVSAVYEASSWSHEDPDDINEAIESGLCVTTLGKGGLKVERSVSTYLTDNNPVWSETSTVNSVNECVRDLIDAVADYVGARAVTGTAASIKADVVAALNEQVSDGTIKGFRNVTVEDDGSTFRPFADVAFIEPINFIPIALRAVRIAENA